MQLYKVPVVEEEGFLASLTRQNAQKSLYSTFDAVTRHGTVLSVIGWVPHIRPYHNFTKYGSTIEVAEKSA